MGLPQPVTVNDEYLAAIHGVLGEIRDRLPAPKGSPASGKVDVAEPASVPARTRARKTGDSKEDS